ncbi:MAG: histidine kinase dimerization/phospho-acceptor domain-containing protein [Sideroxydans sp.]|nr:histidine kinase dimerization/phospho-acceptor domain-containing protein [Sideroxydans sp.]
MKLLHQPEKLPLDFWRSLRYYNFYRLLQATLFVLLGGAFGSKLALNPEQLLLFFSAAVIYLTSVLMSFIFLRLDRHRFIWQLSWQVGGDILAVSVFSYLNGGIVSNIGLLLLISLAAAGLVSRGKITLFFAALASLATLFVHTFGVLYSNADDSKFVQVGLLCMAYFAVAWMAQNLAKHAVDSQQLAARRGLDLLSLSEASRLVMRDMQDGVLVIDAQGVIVQMNPNAMRMLQHPAASGELLSEVFPMLFGQYALWKYSGQVSNDTVQLDVGVQVRLRLVAVQRDAEHGVVIFLEDMQRVQAQAQQIKLAALGRLTANIAHEVRNPLSAISYATELLQEDALTPTQQRLLQMVLDNTQRINQIVSDVMQLNRRDRVRAEEIALADFLADLRDEFNQAEHLAAGVLVLEINAPVAEHLMVQFDRDQLRQVLWNLMLNGLRHGHAQPASLLLRAEWREDRVQLFVEDDGAGVAVAHQARLFEPFFTTAEQGTGLGLYIAKELCAANGAELLYAPRVTQLGASFGIIFAEVRHDGNKISQ